MTKPLHRLMTAIVAGLGHPGSLVVLVICAGLWWRIQPESFDLHGIATLVAVAMTLVIQRGQNRDTAALQAKLDELILATEGARNELVGLDEETEGDIDEIRHAGKTP